jgi:hypothetical protein
MNLGYRPCLGESLFRCSRDAAGKYPGLLLAGTTKLEDHGCFVLFCLFSVSSKPRRMRRHNEIVEHPNERSDVSMMCTSVESDAARHCISRQDACCLLPLRTAESRVVQVSCCPENDIGFRTRRVVDGQQLLARVGMGRRSDCIRLMVRGARSNFGFLSFLPLFAKVEAMNILR